MRIAFRFLMFALIATGCASRVAGAYRSPAEPDRVIDLRSDDSVSFADIAGEYHFLNGPGVNCSLSVSATGKFSFQWKGGCLGTFETNEGAAVFKEGVLHLGRLNPNRYDDFRGPPTEFYPVFWGARMYLIPTNDIVEFWSDFNQGIAPRTVRRGDADKAVWGKPGVPDQWTGYFLAQPVRGKILELIGKQEAWLDKGSDDGLLEGMILTAQRSGNLIFSKVQVEAVEKCRCRIRCQWYRSELAVGQTVTSRFHE